jgi:hypothetical protein
VHPLHHALSPDVVHLSTSRELTTGQVSRSLSLDKTSVIHPVDLIKIQADIWTHIMNKAPHNELSWSQRTKHHTTYELSTTQRTKHHTTNKVPHNEQSTTQRTKHHTTNKAPHNELSTTQRTKHHTTNKAPHNELNTTQNYFKNSLIIHEENTKEMNV